MEERQWYGTAGAEQSHTVSLADVADILNSTDNGITFDATERNCLTLQPPRALVPDIMRIIASI